MSQLLTSYIHDAERIAAIEDRFEPDIQQGIDPNRVHDLDTTYPADLIYTFGYDKGRLPALEDRLDAGILYPPTGNTPGITDFELRARTPLDRVWIYNPAPLTDEENSMFESLNNINDSGEAERTNLTSLNTESQRPASSSSALADLPDLISDIEDSPPGCHSTPTTPVSMESDGAEPNILGEDEIYDEETNLMEWDDPRLHEN